MKSFEFKQAYVWLIGLIGLFSLVIITKSTLFDMDSYYFAGIACSTIVWRPLTDSAFTGIIFQSIPCGLIWFKLLLIGIFVSCTLILYKTGKLIHEDYAHWLPFLIGCGMTFYSYFGKMEDDTIGLLFIFGSLYYLVKWAKSRDYIDFFTAIGIALAGFSFWKGIIIWVLIAMAAGPISWIFSGIILYLMHDLFIPRFYPLVAEELPLAGVLSSSLILVGALGLPMVFIPSVSFAFMLAMIKLKYALFLMILCGLGLFYYLCSKHFFLRDTKRVLGFKKSSALIMILLMVNVTNMIGIYSGPPSHETVELVGKMAIMARDQNISHVFNDWEFGHLIAYHGLVPSHQFGPPTPSFVGIDQLILTRQVLSCPIIGFDSNVFLYNCNQTLLSLPGNNT